MTVEQAELVISVAVEQIAERIASRMEAPPAEHVVFPIDRIQFVESVIVGASDSESFRAEGAAANKLPIVAHYVDGLIVLETAEDCTLVPMSNVRDFTPLGASTPGSIANLIREFYGHQE